MRIHSTTLTPMPDLAFVSQHLFTAILWVDESLTIKWLNTQAEQLLAVSRGRLLNHSILTLLAPEELMAQNPINSRLNAKLDAQKTCLLTERFAHARQYQQPFIDHDHSISPQLLASSGNSNHVTVLVDYSVTPVNHDSQVFFVIEMWGKDRQSRISKEQQQQQQYDVARHMLRSVAHEVKNPLAGIRGAAQLLQRQFTKLNTIQSSNIFEQTTELQIAALNQKLLTYTDIIISETDRLTQLIGQLLGSNQLPNWQGLNIHETLEHVLTLILSQHPSIKLIRDYDLSLPEIEADKDQLIQVFLNLINNACESMHEHQQALLIKSDAALYDDIENNTPQTQASYQPELSIQTRIIFQHTIGIKQHKQVLQIVITDNGGGIAPALIDQIFFPMVTSRAAGTGLGLAIVQDIISRHHGMIDVSSEQLPNAYTTSFTLYLPFTQPIAS